MLGNLVDASLDCGVDALFDAGVYFFQQVVEVFFHRGGDATESLGCGCVSCKTLDFLDPIIFGLKVGGDSDVVLDGFIFPCAYCWRGKSPDMVNLEKVMLLFVRSGDRDAVALESRLIAVEAAFELSYCFRLGQAELPAAKVAVATLLNCWFVKGGVLGNFFKVVDWSYFLVAVDVVLEVFEELGVKGVAYVLAHPSDKTLGDVLVTVKTFDSVVGGAKVCGSCSCW